MALDGGEGNAHPSRMSLRPFFVAVLALTLGLPPAPSWGATDSFALRGAAAVKVADTRRHLREDLAEETLLSAGRNASAFSILNLNLSLPPMALLDPVTEEWNVSLLEQIVQWAAENVGQRLGARLDAKIIGSTRYLRSGGQKDIDLLLVIPTEDREERIHLATEFGRVEQNSLKSFIRRDSRRLPIKLPLESQVRIVTSVKQESRVVLEVFRNRWNAWKNASGYSSLSFAKTYIAIEYYIGDDSIWRAAKDRFLSLSFDPKSRWERGEQEPTMGEQLADLTKETELLSRISKRLEEPARPFDSREDMGEPFSPELVERVVRLVVSREKTGEFPRKAEWLAQLQEAGRQDLWRWAKHLPGTSRANYLPDGRRVRLVRDEFRYHYEGPAATIHTLPQAQQDALMAFLVAKLLHEHAEVVMETHPDVRWAMGDNDPELPHTEAVAYRAELRFLAAMPNFLKSFTPLVSNHPLLWSGLYVPALTAVAAGQQIEAWLDSAEGHRTLTDFLEAINCGTPDWAKVVEFETYLQEKLLQLPTPSLVMPVGLPGRNADAISSRRIERAVQATKPAKGKL